MYTSIELFAGAGGLALGLEQAGFQHLGLVEFNRDAADTLKKNRPEWNVLCEDVALTAQRDLEAEFGIKKYELDLLSGGAPCQSFSYAGKRLGLQDIRGTMFHHYATFLHKLQPKMFLFENVKGLLSHDSGMTYRTILNIFEDEGYTTFHKVLNAWNFGVPQKRERLITIGIRNDLLDKCHFEFPVEHDYKPVVRDVKLDVDPPLSECTRYSANKASVFSLVPPGGYWRDIDPAVAKAYMKTCWDMGGGRTGILRRIGLDEPSLAVLTNPGMKQTDRCHPLEVRPFSYRENARFQTFPDDWEFCGKLSERYKQVGNAVPVNLAKEIGLCIKSALEGKTMWPLSFISEEDFKDHVIATIEKYGEKLESYDIERFNSNLIDPIKLIFDKMVYHSSWEEIVKNEIFRQRDKSNNNDIGYFHQKIFQYIAGCHVPPNGEEGGWDVIFQNPDGISLSTGDCVHTVYVEMKNKHNTMNSASAGKTYIKMQNQLLQDDDCACFLVEAIAKRSQDIKWETTVDKRKVSHRLIRRVSLDRFYAMVTGQEDAFYRMCLVLPDVIESVVSGSTIRTPHDTVMQELQAIADTRGISVAMAIYLLGFSTYNGFQE